MSVQFGTWNFDGKPVEHCHIEKANSVLAPFGPDDSCSYINSNIGILYRPLHTTKESRREVQPHRLTSGIVLTWDGRLDNRAEIIRDLREVLTSVSTDVEIVAAAYEGWGTDCFARLIGDWALSIWDPNGRSVILAVDPIGVRRLYYLFDENHASWSTVLDPLILLGDGTLGLCEEYIAGWLSFFPRCHLTPYSGIYSVPPASFAFLRAGTHTVKRYWWFDSRKRICYRTDGEYEEHFRSVFTEAVRRRLRSDTPILAELSGGMDLTSIVCIADAIIARGAVESTRLDTLSYFNESEPNWNERPFFTKVEQKRGRTGCHIDLGLRRVFKFDLDDCHFASGPASCASSDEAFSQMAACLKSQGNRVVLSGVGGDEVMGGVPTPTLEIQDDITRFRIAELVHQLKVWAVEKRRPWVHLLLEAACGFVPPALLPVRKLKEPVPWLSSEFVRRNKNTLRGYDTRLNWFGSLPSVQANIAGLASLCRQMACYGLQSDPPYENRYPYLDLNLLEFAFAVPREQMVRAGHRRSLMRRALVGVVPQEILERKRKAFVARKPMKAISTEWPSLTELCDKMMSASLRIVEPDHFVASLREARNGGDVPLTRLLRTVFLEAWLRRLRNHGFVIDTHRSAFNHMSSHFLVSAEKT